MAKCRRSISQRVVAVKCEDVRAHETISFTIYAGRAVALDEVAHTLQDAAQRHCHWSTTSIYDRRHKRR